MTKKELLKLLESYSDDVHISIRAKDDFLLTESMIYSDIPYFGNCREGSQLQVELCEKDEFGNVDYETTPEFLIFDSGVL